MPNRRPFQSLLPGCLCKFLQNIQVATITRFRSQFNSKLFENLLYSKKIGTKGAFLLLSPTILVSFKTQLLKDDEFRKKVQEIIIRSIITLSTRNVQKKTPDLNHKERDRTLKSSFHAKDTVGYFRADASSHSTINDEQN